MIYEAIKLGDFEEATLTPFCLEPCIKSPTPCRAIIVCPGGGYAHVSPRESEVIAVQYMAAGFAAFVLSYGVKENAAGYRPLKQVALAIRHVRENAEKYNVDPNYVFTCGFSAGGHLAASAGVLWNSPVLDKIAEGAPRDIVRPTAMILSYPVISAGKWGHQGSFRALTGDHEPTDAQKHPFSLEHHVDATTPPAFIWHTFTDKAVPVQNSLLFAEAMTAAGVPFELHVFPEGPHGLSLANEMTATNENSIRPNVAKWLELSIRWAKDLQV